MRRLIVAGAALTLLVAPPPAMAWTVNDVIRDCSLNGKLSHDYPPSLIRKARNSLPADIDEYTDCRDLLATPTASSSGSSGGGQAAGGGSSGTSAGTGSSSAPGGTAPAGSSASAAATQVPPSPTERKALDAARTGTGGEAVDVGGTRIVPGAAAMTTGAVDNGLPSSLLIVLVVLGLAIAAAGGPLLRRSLASGRARVVARRAG